MKTIAGAAALAAAGLGLLAQAGEAAAIGDDVTSLLALVSAITVPACGALSAAVWRLYKDREADRKRHEAFLRELLKRVQDAPQSRPPSSAS